MSIDEVKMRHLRALEEAYVSMGGDKTKIDTETEYSVFMSSAKALLGKDFDEEGFKETFGLSLTKPAAATEAAAVQAQPQAQNVTSPAAEKPKTVEDEVKQAFDAARGYDAKTGKYAKTLKDAYKEVEEKFTDKKKYNKEQRKQYEKALKALEKDTKHALADEAASDARQSTLAVDNKGNVVNRKALAYTDADLVRKAEIEALTTKDGKVDKRAKKALRQKNTNIIKRFGNWLSGNDSAGKTDDKSVASANKAARKREGRYTAEDLKKALGNESSLLKPYTDDKGNKYENVLVATGLITKGADGKYDIS